MSHLMIEIYKTGGYMADRQPPNLITLNGSKYYGGRRSIQVIYKYNNGGFPLLS